jgi:hypothetical protein
MLEYLADLYLGFPPSYMLSPMLHYGMIAAMFFFCVMIFVLMLGAYGIHKNDDYRDDRLGSPFRSQTDDAEPTEAGRNIA